MPAPASPRVTIGLPVFNGAATIAEALSSLTRQGYPHFKVVISDNASTDATADICRRFAESDPRVEYYRQNINIGGEANFNFVLHRAVTEYFMWAAADDIRSPDYLELCVAFLDAHHEYVASTCPTRFMEKPPVPWDMGDRSLESESLCRNFIDFFPTLSQWHANAHIYSLFRRAALVSSTRNITHFLGSDWAIIIQALTYGKFRRLDAGYLLLGRHGTSNRLNFFRMYRTRPVHWILPFAEFSRITLRSTRGLPARCRLRICKHLAIINFQGILKHIKYEVRIYRSRHRK